MAESPDGDTVGKCAREQASAYQVINESGTAENLPPLMPLGYKGCFFIINNHMEEKTYVSV